MEGDQDKRGADFPGRSHWPVTDVDSSDLDRRALRARTSGGFARNCACWLALPPTATMDPLYTRANRENATISIPGRTAIVFGHTLAQIEELRQKGYNPWG